MPSKSQSTRASGTEAERRVRRFYLLRGYRLVAANATAGGNELDLVVRRGRRLLFVEVKARAGTGFGDPSEAVGPEKTRRVRRAAEGFLARNPQLLELDVAFEVAAVRNGKVERTPLTL
jgi:putative endonuclease